MYCVLVLFLLMGLFYCVPVLVVAGIARGMGVTHYDVVDFKDRILGSGSEERS